MKTKLLNAISKAADCGIVLTITAFTPVGPITMPKSQWQIDWAYRDVQTGEKHWIMTEIKIDPTLEDDASANIIRNALEEDTYVLQKDDLSEEDV